MAAPWAGGASPDNIVVCGFYPGQRCGRIAFGRSFVDADSTFVTEMSLARDRAMLHAGGMEISRKSPGLPESERRELLREGRAVLVSLGEGRLAREYCRLAETAASREELAELLLTCIIARRPR